MTSLVCPTDKVALVRKPGLEGWFCPKCDYWIEGSATDGRRVSASEIFSEERCRPLRGVPMNTICIGSETKGRVTIQIPVGCSDDERRFLIDCAIDDLAYTKKLISDRDIDVFTTKKEKSA